MIISQVTKYQTQFAAIIMKFCRVVSVVLPHSSCTTHALKNGYKDISTMSRQSTDFFSGISITLFFFINPPTDQRAAPINGTFTTDSTFSAQLNSVFTPDRVTSP